MKYFFKTLSILSLALILCSSFFVTNAYAHTDDNNLTIGESNSDDSKALIYCDTSPTFKHEAFSRGTGTLYRKNSDGSKTKIFSNGCAWQCKYCLQVIVTQRDPKLFFQIGYYATWNPGYVTSIHGTVLTAKNIYHTTSSSLPGYNFRYN